MAVKTWALLIWLVLLCGNAYGKADRWSKLMEDSDLVYYMDDKSILNTKTGTTIFWMKLASRKKDFLKNEYKMPELDYILFNYEINCDKAVYKSRGVIYYDRNGRQLDKQVPTAVDMSDSEPVPPESVMEVAKEYVCPDKEESLPQQIVPDTAPAPSTRAPELPAEPEPMGR